MANPASIDLSNGVPAIIEAAAGERSIALPAGCSFDLYHLGVDVADVESTSPIFFSDATGVAASYAAGARKWVLQPGVPLPIRAGIGTLYFKAATGSPTFQIVPWARSRSDDRN